MKNINIRGLSKNIFLLLLVGFMSAVFSGCTETKDHREIISSGHCAIDADQVGVQGISNLCMNSSYKIDLDTTNESDKELKNEIESLYGEGFFYTRNTEAMSDNYLIVFLVGANAGAKKEITESKLVYGICAKKKNEDGTITSLLDLTFYPVNEGICEFKSYCIYSDAEGSKCSCEVPLESNKPLNENEDTKYCEVYDAGKIVDSSNKSKICLGDVDDNGRCQYPTLDTSYAEASSVEEYISYVSAKSLNRATLTPKISDNAYLNINEKQYVRRCTKALEAMGDAQDMNCFCDKDLEPGFTPYVDPYTNQAYCVANKTINRKITYLLSEDSAKKVKQSIGGSYKSSFVNPTQDIEVAALIPLIDGAGPIYRACREKDRIDENSRCLCDALQTDGGGAWCRAAYSELRDIRDITQKVTSRADFTVDEDSSAVLVAHEGSIELGNAIPTIYNPNKNSKALLRPTSANNYNPLAKTGSSAYMQSDAEIEIENEISATSKAFLRADEEQIVRRTEKIKIHRDSLANKPVNECGDEDGYITYTRTFIKEDGTWSLESTNKDEILKECMGTTYDGKVCVTYQEGAKLTLTDSMDIKEVDGVYAEVNHNYYIDEDYTQLEVLEGSIQVCE